MLRKEMINLIVFYVSLLALGIMLPPAKAILATTILVVINVKAIVYKYKTYHAE